MKSVFAFGGLAVAALLFALLPACSSTTTPTPSADTPDPPITQCDPAKCSAGNECLSMDGDLKCRKPCGSNLDPATSCPSNFFCAAANEPSTIPPGCTKVAVAASKVMCAPFAAAGSRLTGYTCADVKPTGCVATGDPAAGAFCCNAAPAEQLAKPLCVKEFREVTPGPKQWGAACNPTKGLEKNDDCDTAQGFFCYGTSPADAAAYCTRYDCHANRECTGGFTCATINVAPNVTTAKRTFHETTTACLRRDYCAPCKADLDCPPLTGRTQHCVPDDNGAGFCTPECTDSNNCNFEAKCINSLGTGPRTCYPRAGSCVGDASLCSPCRNDADCGDDGACVKGEYTTERSCAKKSTGTCTNNSRKCTTSSKPGAKLGCAVPDSSARSPIDNYCYGLYTFSQGEDLGCWTPAR